MKRRIWLAILLTLLLTVFAACGSKDKPTVDASSKETSAVVTDPTGNQPAESAAPETDAHETAPAETNLTETAPAENNPAETDSAETSPAETDSVETETPHTHAWGDWTTIEEATCTETGMSERTCACGEKETQDIEALGHTEAIDEAVAPTCTETGLTEGKHCSVCHEVLLSQETVDALGHDEIFHEGQNASCTENGWDEYRTCSRCDYTTYTEVPALGHTVFSFVEYEAPVQLYVAVNDETYPFTINGDGIIISTNHDDDSVATYTIIAQRSIKLDFAFAVSSESNYDYLVVEYNGSILKSVSGSQDWESYYINLSEGDVFSFSYSKDYSSSDGQDCIYIFFFTEPTASVVEEPVIATEEILASMQATCIEDVCCQECDAVLIERLGHTEVIDAAVAPTASETGLTEGKHCAVCNEILVEQEVIPAIGSIGLSYELNRNGTGYIVTGIGICEDSEIFIPEIYNGLPVTEIARRAFYNCKSITEITIPSTVTAIGEQPLYKADNLKTVFYNSPYSSTSNPFLNLSHITTVVFGGEAVPNYILCGNIYVKQVIILNGVTSIGRAAFDGCNNLSTVYIPDSVTSINDFAFADCSSLLRIDTGNGVSVIAGTAFSGCTGLTTVILGDGLTSLGTAFSNLPNLTTVVLGDNVKSLGPSAFEHCYKLADIFLPDGLTTIEQKAFYYCESLTTITLPESVTTIGQRAFYYCTSLKSIVIPCGVPEIKDNTFAGCSSLMSVSIPDSVTVIELDAFAGCTSLISINIPDSVTEIGWGAFEACAGLISVVIPDSVKSIGTAAFARCTGLFSITIPDSVQYMNESVFEGCTSLVSVRLPDSITRIPRRMFSGCTGLTHVIIGDSVKEIEFGAFMSCSNLTSIVIPDSLTDVSMHAFDSCSNVTDVYYYGTATEWNDIYIDSWGNSGLTSATIHYNYDPNQTPDDDNDGDATLESKYSIYIDNEYFIDTDDNFRYIVAEKYTYYQLFIKDNETGEILTYGTDGLTCVSADDSMVSVGPSGTMVIHQEGGVSISLVQNGTVLDTIAVHGCVENSRITNYAATKDSELFSNGFAPNNRLKVFNYQSTFVEDSSYEGGGYYKVTFDVYNDVPTYFCVAVFDKNDNLLDQKLIDGYSGGVVSEMVDTFINIGDWFNGNLVSGETEIGQKKTSVEFEVPLGGYVDFLTLNNSYHMVFANTLCGVVIHAMEAGEDWAKLIEVASTDIDVDKVKFGEALVNKIAKNLDLSPDEVIKKIMDLAVDKDDYAAFATSLMTFIWSSEITLEDLFITLAECTKSDLPGLSSEMVNGSIDLALTVIPPAKILKKLADATVSSLQYAIILKDIAYMSTNNNDFLIIVYPTEHIS